MSNKILITGAAGGVGGHLIERLAGTAELVGFDARRGASDEVEWHVGDITDVDAVTRAAAGCDAVVHLAGIPIYSEDKRIDIGRVNVFGTQVVLDAVVRADVGYFVQASSICAAGFIFGRQWPSPAYFPIDEQSVGDLDDIYSMGKSIDEQLARGYSRRYGFRATNLRMATVWVPDHAPTEELLTELLKPEQDDDLEYRDLRWQYVDVRDVTQAFELALTNSETAAEVYNVGAADSPGGDWRVWLEDLYPDAPVIKNPVLMMRNPQLPLWTIDRISAELGYEPQHSWREYKTFVNAWDGYLQRRAAR